MNNQSRWSTHRRYLYLLAKLFFFGLFVFGGWWLFGRLSNVLMPLAISMLIAYVLDPVVDWFEARKVSRTLSIFFLMFVGIAALTVFILVVTPTIVDEVESVAKKVPSLGRNIRDMYFELQAYLSSRFGYTLPETLSETFANYGQKIEEIATQLLESLTSFTAQVVSGTFVVIGYLVNVLLVPVFVFYFLRDFDLIKKGALELIPLPWRPAVVSRAQRVDMVVGHWLRGQLTVASIIGASYAVALTILDVKLGIPIAILAGFVSVIPYVGNLIFLTLVLTMSVLDDGSGWGQIIGIMIAFGLVQLAEGYVITPKIVGEKVGLSPVMVIIVLLVGAELFGFLGVLLAIPAAAVIRVFMLEGISDYKRSRLFLGEEKYLKLLVEGAEGADAEVREALRQSAEARLDIELPDPLSDEERARLGTSPSQDDEDVQES